MSRLSLCLQNFRLFFRVPDVLLSYFQVFLFSSSFWREMARLYDMLHNRSVPVAFMFIWDPWTILQNPCFELQILRKNLFSHHFVRIVPNPVFSGEAGRHFVLLHVTVEILKISALVWLEIDCPTFPARPVFGELTIYIYLYIGNRLASQYGPRSLEAWTWCEHDVFSVFTGRDSSGRGWGVQKNC